MALEEKNIESMLRFVKAQQAKGKGDEFSLEEAAAKGDMSVSTAFNILSLNTRKRYYIGRPDDLVAAVTWQCRKDPSLLKAALKKAQQEIKELELAAKAKEELLSGPKTEKVKKGPKLQAASKKKPTQLSLQFEGKEEHRQEEVAETVLAQAPQPDPQPRSNLVSFDALMHTMNSQLERLRTMLPVQTQSEAHTPIDGLQTRQVIKTLGDETASQIDALTLQATEKEAARRETLLLQERKRVQEALAISIVKAKKAAGEELACSKRLEEREFEFANLRSGQEAEILELVMPLFSDCQTLVAKIAEIISQYETNTVTKLQALQAQIEIEKAALAQATKARVEALAKIEEHKAIAQATLTQISDSASEPVTEIESQYLDEPQNIRTQRGVGLGLKPARQDQSRVVTRRYTPVASFQEQQRA